MRFLCKADKILYQTDSRSFPRGGTVDEPYYFREIDPFIVNPKLELVDGIYTLVEDDAVALTKAVTVLYDTMVTDIYDALELEFGTRNDAAVSADMQSYERMIKQPATYAPLIGTEAEVIAFAEGKLADADTYAVFRLGRLATFKIDRDALLNPE